MKKILEGGKYNDRQCDRPVRKHLLMDFQATSRCPRFIWSLIHRHDLRATHDACDQRATSSVVKHIDEGGAAKVASRSVSGDQATHP